MAHGMRFCRWPKTDFLNDPFCNHDDVYIGDSNDEEDEDTVSEYFYCLRKADRNCLPRRHVEISHVSVVLRPIVSLDVES